MAYKKFTASEDMLKPGVAVGVEGFSSKRTPDELRAATITIGKRSFELR